MKSPIASEPSVVPPIAVKDLSVAFGGVRVLDRINLSVAEGQLVALIGPNGSGKTTLLRTLLGMVTPAEGSLELFGRPGCQHALPRIGYVPQKVVLDGKFALSVREFLALRMPRTRHWFFHSPRYLDRYLLDMPIALGLAPLLDRPLVRLSGGQLQRVLIAFSLLPNPELLLLDEPTTGVDQPGEQSFYELIAEVHKNRRCTILLVSHDLSLVCRHASYVYAINRTICCEGRPEEIMDADSLKRAFGIHVTPYHHHHHAH